MKYVISLPELDAEYGTRPEEDTRAILARKGGAFDPHARTCCLRRAAGVMFEQGIGLSLCFEDLGRAMEEYARQHPERPLAPLEAIMVDWPDREKVLAQMAEIMAAEEAPEPPSFSDFDTDTPEMAIAYAKLLRQRLGRGPRE